MKLFLDYETYYDDEYSLRKMTPAEYILDKRFQVHGCAVQEDSKPGWWCDAKDLPRYFKSLNAGTTVVFTFNALFDMCITEWIYGFDPFMMVDVLGMSRALRGYSFTSHSLANVAKQLGLPAKRDTLAKVKGMRTEQIKAQPALWQEFKNYALVDNELCSGIASILLPEFPKSEMRVMDLVLRCCVQPQLRLNRKRLVMHRRKLRQHKQDLIDKSLSDKISLMSATKFAALLTEYGVEVAYKPGKNKLIPAVAKTDQFMADMMDHEDKHVRALAQARLGIRSTLEETRAKRFAALARLPGAYGYAPGSAPVALRYGAAHTGRLGGEWKLNFQNLTRGGELRYAIEASPDDVVVSADYSQIEARMVAYLAKQENLLDMFAMSKSDPSYDPYTDDPYNVLGGVIFGRPVNRKLFADLIEGFIGKTGILGLNYGAGKATFYTAVHRLARTQLGHDVEFTQEKADKAVDVYRNELFPEIPKLWSTFDSIIADLSLWDRDDLWAKWHDKFPMLHFEHEAIILPNGMKLRYHDLRKDENDWQWVYTYGRETRIIYGAKCVENVSQALTGIIAKHAALRLHDRGIRMALQAHDELVFAVKKIALEDELVFAVRKTELERVEQIITEEMLKVPSWAPGFPLGVEIKHGLTYGDAK